MKFKIENTQVYGYERAIKASGNPMRTVINTSEVTEKDLSRAIKLGTTKQGAGHDNFLKGILVQVDVTAPLYWWKEYDTYKVGTVANSCSTMHKIHSKELTLDDFSCEHLEAHNIRLLEQIIDALNTERYNFNFGKQKSQWWQMIQLLPSSYNQKKNSNAKL